MIRSSNSSNILKRESGWCKLSNINYELTFELYM